MIFSLKNSLVVCVVSMLTALQPQTAEAQTPLSYEQKYCVGMAGVTAGTMEMVQAGRRSWPEIQNELIRTVREAGWPLNQANFDEAVQMGLTGARGGDDPRTVAQFIMRECIQSVWYAQ